MIMSMYPSIMLQEILKDFCNNDHDITKYA